MKEAYFESVVMIERLHRLFLEVIKVELERMKVLDINNVQCLILYNIGESQVTIGELTNRGYYLGSNVSYNLRKMVQSGYLIQQPSPHDRRSSHVCLSKKGLELYRKLDELFSLHAQTLANELQDETLEHIAEQVLRRLENFWNALLTRELRRN